LWGLANYHQARSQFALAVELAAQLVQIAEAARAPQQLAWAHLQSGATRFWMGEYATSLVHLEQAISDYDPNVVSFLPGAPDPYAAAQVYAALVHWQLGHSDRAIAAASAGVRFARERKHAFSLSIALCFSGTLHQQRRDVDAVREAVDEVIPLASEYGFPIWRGWGTLLQGWSRAQSGEGPQGIDTIRSALNDIATTGSTLGGPGALMFLAEAQQTAGLAEDAATTASSALAIAEQLGQHAWDAELLRLRGEALLQARGPDDPEVETHLRRALATARAGESQLYAVRAAASLARLLVRRDAVEEARALLAAAAAAAPPGFDAPDRHELTSLLRSLA
jgi:predicted ATPase